LGAVSVYFSQFVQQVEGYGMPVKFLKMVASKYTFGTTSGIANTNVWLNNIDLSESELSTLRSGFRPGGTLGESPTIGTLYHESTHAYLDLRDGEMKFKAFISDGEKYYKGASLSNGKSASDPGRIFQEAAASYVGQRAATWYGTYDFIESISEGIDEKTWAGKGDPAYYDRVEKLVAKIPGDYDRSMRERVFGYQESWGDQVETTKPISAAIKGFCDLEILEGKISDSFESSGFLKQRHQKLLDQIKLSRTLVPIEVVK